ncbi:MATE family efflux transporter [Tenacibaculum agarivorans]|uniref:polysaccharide biosynthesis C-terminal domain-containing protein n=1 Tax=Tenacibaculum agarivorans TaxID=1908389 RepID=UPI00094BA03B|nr:polysaccharide biosynthesis C-terminal domain-containing protein [Tenacibaculum agarivorans]
MSRIKKFIQSFLSRSGSYVFAASILSKVLSFVTSWIALQFIENKILGEVLFSWNIVVFLLPFIGFGLHQSLIRYGALALESDKKIILRYVLKHGTICSFILTIVVMGFAIFYPFKFEKTHLYLFVFSQSFVPFFWFETIKIQLRLEHNNKMFSWVDIIYNVLLCILVLILSYLYQQNGYVIAIVLSPILVTLFFNKHLKTGQKSIKKLSVFNLEFWKYGFFGGLTGVTTTLLFVIDLLLIGNILDNPEYITAYKYVSIIPLSLLFLPRVFMTTDFVSYTEKIRDRNYIINYIKSYITTFLIISLLVILFLFTFSHELLSLFDPSFVEYSNAFQILAVGISGILILRGVFGNLLCSIGKIKINYYITLVALVINFITNYQLIPSYGITGAAITSASMMWFTGIATCICFFIYYKNEKNI